MSEILQLSEWYLRVERGSGKTGLPKLSICEERAFIDVATNVGSTLGGTIIGKVRSTMSLLTTQQVLFN